MDSNCDFWSLQRRKGVGTSLNKLTWPSLFLSSELFSFLRASRLSPEALILRADRQKRIEQLKQRLLRNAKVQEGDKPAEDPKELIKDIERISEELTLMIQRINRTNTATDLKQEVTITDALAVRDILKLKHGIYRDLAQSATVTQDRYSKSEIKFKGTVNVTEIQERADQLAKECRELDAAIQEANWRTELL